MDPSLFWILATLMSLVMCACVVHQAHPGAMYPHPYFVGYARGVELLKNPEADLVVFLDGSCYIDDRKKHYDVTQGDAERLIQEGLVGGNLLSGHDLAIYPSASAYASEE